MPVAGGGGRRSVRPSSLHRGLADVGGLEDGAHRRTADSVYLAATERKGLAGEAQVKDAHTAWAALQEFAENRSTYDRFERVQRVAPHLSQAHRYPAARTVSLHLAAHWNFWVDLAWPSQAAVAAATGLSVDTVRRAIEYLVDPEHGEWRRYALVSPAGRRPGWAYRPLWRAGTWPTRTRAAARDRAGAFTDGSEFDLTAEEVAEAMADIRAHGVPDVAPGPYRPQEAAVDPAPGGAGGRAAAAGDWF